MGGFFSRLFGGSKGEAAASEAPGEAVDYKGFRIRPAPFRAEGQFQTAGLIEKDFAEGRKEYRFIRAERHTSADEASEFAVSKGRQIIDEQGDRVFDKS
jgi:hypothetical protein